MNNSETKALSMLSIAAKAGKVVSGGFMTEKAIAEGSARFVIIAEDASANTQKKFTNKCKYYRVPYAIFSNSDKLGKFVGKQDRTTIAVTDEGLANQISSRILCSENMEV